MLTMLRVEIKFRKRFSLVVLFGGGKRREGKREQGNRIVINFVYCPLYQN